MRERTHTGESLTAQGKTTPFNRLFAYFRSELCGIPCILSSLCILQARLEKRGPICIPERCNMPCVSYCASFRYCTGSLLPWGRRNDSRFAGIAGIGICGGGFVVSVQITCCFNMYRMNGTTERTEKTEEQPQSANQRLRDN